MICPSSEGRTLFSSFFLQDARAPTIATGITIVFRILNFILSVPIFEVSNSLFKNILELSESAELLSQSV